MEDHLGEVEVVEADSIQVTVEDGLYNLLVTKETNYVMRMIATGGRFLADVTCKETARIWKGNG